jgi:hypothetical protein
MSDEELRAAYRAALERRRPPGRAECVPEGRLQAVLEGRLAEAERLATLEHAASCAACREELELLRALSAAASAGGARALPRRRALALAASVVLLLAGGALVGRVLRAPPVVRGPADQVRLLAPAESVAAAAPLTFSWEAVAGASRYRVQVTDASGALVFETTTRGTTAALPDSVRLVPGGAYAWWVEATLAGGGAGSSAVRRLRPR